MKKCLKISCIIFAAVLTLFNIWARAIDAVYAMPAEMKKESVCFLASDLTWNSTMSDVKDLFGEPLKKVYHEETGREWITYNAQYDNRAMTVRAARKAFSLTEMFNKQRVFAYYFDIECVDAADEKAVFEALCEKLIVTNADNERFEYDKELDNEFSAQINFGPCYVCYYIRYDVRDGESVVSFDADALY